VHKGAQQSLIRRDKIHHTENSGFCHNGSDLQQTLYILYTNRRTKINSQCAALMFGIVERNAKAATIEVKSTRERRIIRALSRNN
jgi:hypothetical protein